MPTYDEEMDAAQHDTGISGSCAGGADGMQVTDTLLRQVDVGVLFLLRSSDDPITHSDHVIFIQGLLSPRGRFYLVAVKQNNVPRVREFMLETFSLQSEVNNCFGPLHSWSVP